MRRVAGKGAVGRRRNDSIAERVAVNVLAGQNNGQRGIFSGRESLRVCRRRIVYRQHGDTDRGDIRVYLSVVRFEGEAIGTVIIKSRSVSQIRCRSGQDPVRWLRK